MKKAAEKLSGEGLKMRKIVSFLTIGLGVSFSIYLLTIIGNSKDLSNVSIILSIIAIIGGLIAACVSFAIGGKSSEDEYLSTISFCGFLTVVLGIIVFFTVTKSLKWEELHGTTNKEKIKSSNLKALSIEYKAKKRKQKTVEPLLDILLAELKKAKVFIENADGQKDFEALEAGIEKIKSEEVCDAEKFESLYDVLYKSLELLSKSMDASFGNEERLKKVDMNDIVKHRVIFALHAGICNISPSYPRRFATTSDLGNPDDIKMPNKLSKKLDDMAEKLEAAFIEKLKLEIGYKEKNFDTWLATVVYISRGPINACSNYFSSLTQDAKDDCIHMYYEMEKLNAHILKALKLHKSFHADLFDGTFGSYFVHKYYKLASLASTYAECVKVICSKYDSERGIISGLKIGILIESLNVAFSTFFVTLIEEVAEKESLLDNAKNIEPFINSHFSNPEIQKRYKNSATRFTLRFVLGIEEVSKNVLSIATDIALFFQDIDSKRTVLSYYATGITGILDNIEESKESSS